MENSKRPVNKISFFRLAAGELFYHRKQQLAVLLGIALSAAILLGALMIGDSVRYSLKQLVYNRLGKTIYAFEGGNRFVTAELAAKISARLPGLCVPVLKLNGIAILDGGKTRVNNIQVLGIDDRFRSLARQPVAFTHPGPGEAVINESLAAGLGTGAGAEILLRIGKPGLIPSELPLLPNDNQTANIRVSIKAVSPAAALGAFSLQTNQALPPTVFLPLSRLQEETGLEQRVNLLLVAASGKTQVNREILSALVKENFTLADAGLSLTSRDNNGYFILNTEKIFLDPPAASAAYAADPSAEGIFSYFANSFRFKDKLTPYSFITGLEKTATGINPAADEIIINSWLADDLGAQPGDRITLSYYVRETGSALEEQNTLLTVKAVVPISTTAMEESLVPAFPGLTDVDNCRDWKPGIPLNLKLIRKKDEDYWNQYKALPKAYINLETAQTIWKNRYGSLTAIRYTAVIPHNGLSGSQSPGREILAEKILEHLDPRALGIRFEPVLEEGIKAVNRGIDFGSLFLGLSFFIIASALFLTILLFQFNAENASAEIGLYLALGIRQSQVQRILFTRGLFLALLGSMAGIIPGILYNQIVLYGLKTIWNQAAGTTHLEPRLEAGTLLLSLFINTLLGAFTLWLAIRKQAHKPVTELIRSGSREHSSSKKEKPVRSLLLAGSCLLLITGLLVYAALYPVADKAGLFFPAGGLALVCCLAFCNAVFILLEKRIPAGRLTLNRAGLRNLIRRRKRSLLSIGLLAGGIFIIVSVGANRKNLPADTEARSSGTGGYSLYIETALPLLFNPGSGQGRKEAGWDIPALQTAEFLPGRIDQGAEASCLNLNYVKQPQLLGIDAGLLDKRGAFTFAAGEKGMNKKSPWLTLEEEPAPGIIPGFVDQTVLTWNLGKNPGDTITYLDEQGKEFEVKIMATLEDTLFQGKILISEKAFLEKFPSHKGYQLLLVDAPPDTREEITAALTRVLQNYGAEWQTTGARLEKFHQVENTYLIIYLLLGGLGLVIGISGFAVVVLRKIAESGNEPAILQAIGFNFSSILRYILAEYWLILVISLLSGTLCSFIALLPLYTEGKLPLPFIAVLLLVMLFNGMLWIFLTTFFAVRGNLAASLRKE